MQAGDTLGDRFRLVGELGRGGTAVVWLAHDLASGEEIALKILHAPFADDPRVRGRLRREARVGARLRHPAALLPTAVHDLDGHLVLALPLHPGVPLDEHVRTHGPWTASALDRLARTLASALAAAHTAGIVHRDVTPRNVLVDDAGEAVLTDFGLARLADGTRSTTVAGPAGTPGFVAPERMEGHAAGPATDLYGLGGVLYTAATGAAPFARGSLAATVRAQLDGDHVPLVRARPDLPPALCATIDALLAVDPSARPAGAAEVPAWLDGRRVADRRDARTLRAARLPEGPCAVVVRETRHDARRRRLRQRRRRTRGAIGAAVDRVLSDVVHTAHRVLDRPLPPEPEDALAAAVARAAGLPIEALRPSRVLFDRRFRLVDGVDPDTAQALATTARELGFDADVHEPVPMSDGLALARRILLPLVPTGIVWATPAPDFVALIVFFAVTVPGWVVVQDRDRAPLAYPRDLAAHLHDGWRVAAAPPRADPADDGPRALATSLRTRLDATRARLDADRTLPSAARADLRTALSALRADLDRLASAAPDAPPPDADVEAEAIATITARLRRLDTLARAGRPAAEGERDRLERALAEHTRALEAAEEADATRVGHLAQLLTIGTALREVDALLAATTTPDDPTRAADDARRHVQAARRALAETA